MGIAVLLGLPIAVAAWIGICINWRWGVYGLVAYTPFTGIVVAILYPSPLGTLVRDILVVVPLYLAFFVLSKQARYDRIPSFLYAAYGALALFVMFAAANPGVPNLMVAGIGVKVWLSYVPLLIVGAAFVRHEDDLRNFLRALVVSAWIPWAVGIFLFVSATMDNYEPVARFFFGDYAMIATSEFGAFDSYGARLFRIPGTFQYNSQYGVFCFFMLFPLLMLLEVERERTWRAFTWASMIVGLVAGFTSGARGNFLFLPLIFVMVQFFKFRAGGMIQGIIGVGGGLIAALAISGIDGSKMYGEVGQLTARYSTEMGTGGILEAFDRGGLLGRGVGTNTGGARHGLDEATAALLKSEGGMVENYYAKAIVELGFFGFIALIACLLLMLLSCLRAQFQIRSPALKGVAACGTAMAAFIVLVSMKGWALDAEPLNYYYYLTMGIMLALPHVDRRMAARAAGQGIPIPAAAPGAAGPRPAVAARPAGIGPGPRHRPLIGRNGYYGDIVARRQMASSSRASDERGPNPPDSGNPKNASS